jgi:hypothetical protein
MDSNRSRAATLIGVAAAAGAFGVAAMMSAATAPTARADDFTDVINAVDLDYSEGTAALGQASTDFSGGNFADGLALLFDGVDDDSVVAPENFLIGTGELLTNESVDVTTSYAWPLPSDFSDAVSAVEGYFTDASSLFTSGATALAGGDYGDALMDYAYGLNVLTVDPVQELLPGAAVSF